MSAFAAPAIMLFALIFFAGCAGSLEASRKEGVASRPHEAGALTVPPTARCISLDNNRTTWGAIAKGALALTGGAGLSAIPFAKDDRNAQIALSIGTGVAAAVAAVSLYVEEGASQDWARECAP